MLTKYAKEFFVRLFSPLAQLLIRWHVSPNTVSVVGATVMTVAALVFYPLGQLFWGTVVITLFVFSDLIDGLMARETGRSSSWGAFLDSSLDRVVDAAVFLGLALWFFGGGNNPLLAILCLVCLILANLISYLRARAESLGAEASGGLAERSERLVITLVAAGLVGLGLPQWVLTAALSVLVCLSLLTIVQRVVKVHRQLSTIDNEHPNNI